MKQFVAEPIGKTLIALVPINAWCIIAIDKLEARRKLVSLSTKMKDEFFITALAIFDEPVDDSRNFHLERENWEKVIKHARGLKFTDVLNVNVGMDFPDTYSSDDSDHVQGLIKYWNI